MTRSLTSCIHLVVINTHVGKNTITNRYADLLHGTKEPTCAIKIFLILSFRFFFPLLPFYSFSLASNPVSFLFCLTIQPIYQFSFPIYILLPPILFFFFELVSPLIIELIYLSTFFFFPSLHLFVSPLKFVFIILSLSV